MFSRFNADGTTGSATPAVDPLTRLDMAPGTSGVDVEIPRVAVKSTEKSPEIPTELPPHIHEKAKVVGLIKSSFDLLEKRKASEKDLEAIRQKLLLGHSDALNGHVKTAHVNAALSVIGSIHSSASSLGLPIKGAQAPGSAVDEALSPFKKSSPLPNAPLQHSLSDPSVASPTDQEQVLGKIEDALQTLDTILGKIATDKSSASNQLLSLTASVTGLNNARSTVDKSQLSISVAMNAVEMIMTNVKAAVVSHGNISTDLVRLVIA